MKLSCMRIMLFLLSYNVCIHQMASLHNHFVDAKTLQIFSDIEIEKQLKVVNKHAVKIIKTIYGDTYGCVDFYKQPAFDHPSMKNHSFHYEMRRTLSLHKSRANYENFGFLWENGIGCPMGTVPIKRVTRDEISNLNLFFDKSKPQSSRSFTNYNHYNVKEQHHFAVLRTKGKKEKYYKGATMVMSINEPKVTSPQTSSSRMHVQMGNDFIQTGWIVNPKLYSDSKTRSFVYRKAGENECYNHMCSVGIISVRSDFPLGAVLGPPCVRGSKTGSYDSFGILKDDANGNWWLLFGGKEIGFWPAKTFQTSFIDKVEWGGEVYSASMPSPEMGNGHFPDKHPAFDAIIFNMTIFDENFKIDEWVKDTEIFRDNTRGYNVINGKKPTYSYFPSKHIIYFGGPGNI